ncbi:hypothetical protein Amsp01_093560 [Amycolatopsis sp. NBRC 101858]|nr:hypothetical protein Amsp01_093560 [Amycolatopsis sp. NBRC 101858]
MVGRGQEPIHFGGRFRILRDGFEVADMVGENSAATTRRRSWLDVTEEAQRARIRLTGR